MGIFVPCTCMYSGGRLFCHKVVFVIEMMYDGSGLYFIGYCLVGLEGN
jgi:hypothetical protein